MVSHWKSLSSVPSMGGADLEPESRLLDAPTVRGKSIESLERLRREQFKVKRDDEAVLSSAPRERGSNGGEKGRERGKVTWAKG